MYYHYCNNVWQLKDTGNKLICDDAQNVIRLSPHFWIVERSDGPYITSGKHLIKISDTCDLYNYCKNAPQDHVFSTLINNVFIIVYKNSENFEVKALYFGEDCVTIGKIECYTLNIPMDSVIIYGLISRNIMRLYYAGADLEWHYVRFNEDILEYNNINTQLTCDYLVQLLHTAEYITDNKHELRDADRSTANIIKVHNGYLFSELNEQIYIDGYLATNIPLPHSNVKSARN